MNLQASGSSTSPPHHISESLEDSNDDDLPAPQCFIVVAHKQSVVIFCIILPHRRFILSAKQPTASTPSSWALLQLSYWPSWSYHSSPNSRGKRLNSF
eukprot:scaffold13593_cov189-Alexandrium_tamarense.AAC.3